MLIDNWKETATGAWSMWAFYLLLILEGVPEVIGALSPDMQPSDTAMSVITIIAIACGAIARLFMQPKIGTAQ